MDRKTAAEPANKPWRQQEGDEAIFQSELISICLALAGRVFWRGMVIVNTPFLNEALMSSLEQIDPENPHL